MVYIKEELNKAVNYETLEAALIEAAKETGLKEKNREVIEENGCSTTKLYLKGFILNSMEIHTYDHGNPIDFFTVYAGHPFGRASKKTVERYIERVHNYLKKS